MGVMRVLRTDRVCVWVQRMRAAVRASLPRTYSLFLGAGYARAKGVLGRAVMARAIFGCLERTDPAKGLHRRLLIDGLAVGGSAPAYEPVFRAIQHPGSILALLLPSCSPDTRFVPVQSP